MFISTSKHKSILARSEEHYREMQSRYVELLNAKDDTINDLRKLVFPVTQAMQPEVLEADSVLSGSEKPYQISEEEHNKLLNEAREVDLLISGNYDEGLSN